MGEDLEFERNAWELSKWNSPRISAYRLTKKSIRRDHGWQVPILLEAALPAEMRLGCVAQSNASGDIGGVRGITGVRSAVTASN